MWTPNRAKCWTAQFRCWAAKSFLTAKSLSTKGRVFFFQDGATAGMEPYRELVPVP